MAGLKKIDRRVFLRGACGAAVALPHLNAMAATASPVRMVCVGTKFGFIPSLFFPRETGSDYALPKLLEPMAHQRSNFTVFSQLDHGDNALGGHKGVHAFLSGIVSGNAKSNPEQNISVDQKAAQMVGMETRYTSMQFSTGADSGNMLSWTRNGSGIPPLSKLNTIYPLLFQAPNEPDSKLLRKIYSDQNSVLDLVQEDAKRLSTQVGKEDREKLDQYFTAIRDLETRLTQSARWLDTPKPEVEMQLPPGADQKLFNERLPLYYDIMTLALQTDSTRIITFEISEIGRQSGGFDVTRGYHQLTHHGQVQSYIDELATIEQFQLQQFGRFLDQLEAVREPGGKTLLDSTMALIGSGMGNANSHSNRDLPLLLAGGGFKHGNHIRYEKNQSRGIATPAANLYTSMLQRFGMEIERFNFATGTLTGLEVA